VYRLTDRFLGFLACCVGGIACFGIAFLFLPLRESTCPSPVSHYGYTWIIPAF
jgi:hypothetical protein